MCICIIIYKYNLFTPFSVTCLCGISGLNIWYWVTKEGLIPGETSSPAISITCLQSVDCQWDPSMSPFYTSMSMGVILQFLFRKPYCWGITGEDFLSFLGNTVSQQLSWCSNSQSFPHPLLKGRLSFGYRMYQLGLGTPSLILYILICCGRASKGGK